MNFFFEMFGNLEFFQGIENFDWCFFFFFFEILRFVYYQKVKKMKMKMKME